MTTGDSWQPGKVVCHPTSALLKIRSLPSLEGLQDHRMPLWSCHLQPSWLLTGWLPGQSGLPALTPRAHPQLTGVQHGLDAHQYGVEKWKGQVRQVWDRLPVFRGQSLWADQTSRHWEEVNILSNCREPRRVLGRKRNLAWAELGCAGRDWKGPPDCMSKGAGMCEEEGCGPAWLGHRGLKEVCDRWCSVRGRGQMPV